MATYYYTDVADSVVKLVKAGAVVGDSKAASTKWPSSDVSVDYGGSADLWGTTLTAAEVNASDFGVVLSAAVTGGTARVDRIAVTVFFSTPAQTDTPAFLSTLWVDDDRLTFGPKVYALPRSGLTIANDPNMSTARDDARLRTSRYYRPSRMVPKTWHQHEFYAEFTPEVSTPGLQVWGIVDDGTPVRLQDAAGDPSLFRTSGHCRAFFPAGTTGNYCAIEYIIPAAGSGEADVSVVIRDARLLASLNPREKNRVLVTLVLGPGEFPDYASMMRTTKEQRDNLRSLHGQVVEYRAPAGESGYATVASVTFEEIMVKQSNTWTAHAKLELIEVLYA